MAFSLGISKPIVSKVASIKAKNKRINCRRVSFGPSQAHRLHQFAVRVSRSLEYFALAHASVASQSEPFPQKGQRRSQLPATLFRESCARRLKILDDDTRETNWNLKFRTQNRKQMSESSNSKSTIQNSTSLLARGQNQKSETQNS